MNVESCQTWQYFTEHIVTTETLQKCLIKQTSLAAFSFLLIITNNYSNTSCSRKTELIYMPITQDLRGSKLLLLGAETPGSTR